MKRAIVALVFRCKITGGDLITNDEVSGFRWATADDITGLADEAYAVRVLDALEADHPVAVRHHDGAPDLTGRPRGSGTGTQEQHGPSAVPSGTCHPAIRHRVCRVCDPTTDVHVCQLMCDTWSRKWEQRSAAAGL